MKFILSFTIVKLGLFVFGYVICYKLLTLNIGQKCYELNPEFCLSASVYFQISGGREETDKSNSATFTVHALRLQKNELP